MTQRKVIAAFVAPNDAMWQGREINVMDDGSWWACNDGGDAWDQLRPPLPPEALGEATDDPPAPDLGEWPGTPDVPPDTIRDIEILTPHGGCIAWYSSNDGWRAYATIRDHDPPIDPRDVLRWRELPLAFVEDGRVTGVRRG